MKTLRNILFWVNCVLPVILVISYFTPWTILYEVGEQLGRLALVLVWLIILPGTIKRFELKGGVAKFGVKLRVIRRQLGILVFQLGLIHYFWMAAFWYTKIGFPAPGEIPLSQTFGFLALAVFLPLFLSSNDLSVRYMKKAWNWLHRLVYAALLFLAFHVGLNGQSTGILFALPSMLLVLVELFSWLYFWYRKIKKQGV